MPCILTLRDFGGLSFSYPATWSVIFRSCIFTPVILMLRHFQVVHFQSTRCDHLLFLVEIRIREYLCPSSRKWGYFWATVYKTVRPMLSVRCLSLSVLCVCDVGTLWSNSWMDQDETWHAGRSRPGHIVLDGDLPPPLSKGHSPQFSAHICCGQVAAWIKVPLGMEVGLDPSNIT